MNIICTVLIALNTFVVNTTMQSLPIIPLGATFLVEWNSEYPNDGSVRFRAWIDKYNVKNWLPEEVTAVPNPLVEACGVAAITCFTYTGQHPGLKGAGVRTIRLNTVDTATNLESVLSEGFQFIVGTAVQAPTIVSVRIWSI